MKLFNGKKTAQGILQDLGEQIKKAAVQPRLAVILVGDDEASKLYIKLKKAAAERIGIGVEEYYFGVQAKEEEIIERIKQLNADPRANGIIVQLPLPAMLDADRIVAAIDSSKDVDGFGEQSRRLLEKGRANFAPVLPAAILTALQAALEDNLKNKKILALVNSEIFGRVLKLVFKKEGGQLDYLVRNTCVVLGAEQQLKSADVLITVCGCPFLIKGEMIKEGAVLIDAGITRYHDGKVVGDVDRESVALKAAFLTPVPGGIGPVSVALLLRNVYLAVKRQSSPA